MSDSGFVTSAIVFLLSSFSAFAQEDGLHTHEFTISGGCLPQGAKIQQYFGEKVAEVLRETKQRNGCIHIANSSGGSLLHTPDRTTIQAPLTVQVVSSGRLSEASIQTINGRLEAAATSSCSDIEVKVGSKHEGPKKSYLLALKWGGNSFKPEKVKIVDLSGKSLPVLNATCDGVLQNVTTKNSSELQQLLDESPLNYSEYALTFLKPTESKWKKEVHLGRIEQPSIQDAKQDKSAASKQGK